MTSVARLAVAAAVVAVVATLTGATAAPAQTSLKLHESIAVPQRPLLCADRDSLNLIVPVLARAADARAARDADKSQRLTEIATRLQGEVCRKPAADDVVILRCKLSQVDAGSSKLALVKVSALIQNEAAKGEQAFYGWTDLKVDDASPGTSGTQEANSRWCGGERAEPATRQIQVVERDGPATPVALVTPSAQDGNQTFNATPDIILRVQQRLYDFGLRIENLDGRLNQETVRNLSHFQRYASLPVDGQLTRSTVEKLMTTPAPAPWVTIAFDGFGNFAAELGRTRRETELTAIERLQRRSSRDFKLSSVAAPSCLGFAVTRYTERGRRSRTKFTQAFTSAGDSTEAAARNAWDYCEREKGGGECQVRYALCADGTGGGQNSRVDPGTIPVNAPAPRFDPTVLPNNAPGPRFDPNSLSVNSQAPRERLGPPENAPQQQPPRFDPRNMPANMPSPSAR